MQRQVEELQGSSAGHEQSALTHRAASLEMERLGQENTMLAERLQQMETDIQVLYSRPVQRMSALWQ